MKNNAIFAKKFSNGVSLYIFVEVDFNVVILNSVINVLVYHNTLFHLNQRKVK